MTVQSLKKLSFEKGSLEDLHQNSRFWLSEIEFWNTEFKFMHNLTKKHFVNFMEEDENETFLALDHKMTQMEKGDLAKLKILVQNHESHLVDLVKNPVVQDERNYREEHQKLDEEIARFKYNFKQVKKELFDFADMVLKAEKYQKFLDIDM